MAEINKEQLDNEPKGKTKNVKPGGDLLDDSFFDSLADIDDGLGIDFSKLGEDTHESINDLVGDSKIKLSPNKKKITSAALPTAKLPKQKVNSKENSMTKKGIGSMLVNDEDPNAVQLNHIWQEMNTPNLSEYKLMVLRLEPQMIKGTKINGYLETFHLPTTIPDIIEAVGQKYGGGKYQLRIVDGTGKYVKSKTFEISGLPKIPKEEVEEESVIPTTSPSEIPTAEGTSVLSNNELDEDNDWDDDDDFETTPRRPLRPLGSNFSPYAPPFSSPYPSSPYSPSFSRKDPHEIRDEVKGDLRNMEDKLTNKLDSKLDKFTDSLTLMASSLNKKPESFLNSDVIKAIAPVFVTWLDNKSNRDSANVGQFSDMNKQMVGLMQGMQDLVRMTDKSKEDLSGKERVEREHNRREMLDYQAKMEDRFLQQQRMAQEQHQAMLMQMKNTLESGHKEAIETEQRLRMDYEKMREEFRQREEAARRETREKEDRSRIESREREEKLREEQRRRDEDAKRREREHRDKILQEERQSREEMRQRDEDLRRKEMEWKDELRLKEMEITEKMRGMDTQRTGIEHELLKQVYNNNYGQRESQLQMEMAIAKMTSDSESKMLQTQAQMELEKIRHATTMQMTKMKHELGNLENKKDEDPFDSAIKEYLQRKLQIDMVNDLNFSVEDDDGGNSMMATFKKVLTEGGPMLAQILGLGGGGMRTPIPAPPPTQQGRIVNPSLTPSPVVPQPKQTVDVEEENYDEDDTTPVENIDNVSEDEEDEDYEDNMDDFYGIDPMQEIPRVADFFSYLKEAIEGGEVTPAQAAVEAKVRLSVPIVTFLQEVQNSEVVIGQLFPLLQTMFDEQFCSFFTELTTMEWMDKMLIIMANPNVPEEVEDSVVPPKVEEPTPKSESKPKDKKIKKVKQKQEQQVSEAETETKVEAEAETKVEAEAETKADEKKPKKSRKKSKKTTTKES